MNLRNINRIILILISVVLIGCSSCEKNTDTDNTEVETEVYKNPVFSPSFADPTFLRDDDGTFYCYSTEEDWNDGEGDKIIPIIKSNDLVNWEYVGNAFSERPDFVNDGQHRWVWSPDAVKYKGKYFLFYSLSYGEDDKAGIGVSWSDKPEGPFIDSGEVLRSDKIGVEHSIAPFFIEDNGKLYTFWGSYRGIYGIELEYDSALPTFRIKGEKFQIAGAHFEGPRISKKGDYYYFISSNGHCCTIDAEGKNWYNIRVARSNNLEGPYLDKNGKGIMRMDVAQPHDGTVIVIGEAYEQFPRWRDFTGPGQNTKIITDDAGNDWIMYHAIERKELWLKTNFIRRPLMISQIVWNDGWPEIQYLYSYINPEFN